jgi:hypothetical protein
MLTAQGQAGGTMRETSGGQTRAIDRPMTQMEARLDRIKEIAGNAESIAARISSHVDKITGPRAQPATDPSTSTKIASAYPPGDNAGPIGIINGMDYQLHRIQVALSHLNEEANNLDGIL